MTSMSLGTISHDSKIDWLEMNETGRKLLYRDKRLRVSLFGVYITPVSPSHTHQLQLIFVLYMGFTYHAQPSCTITVCQHNVLQPLACLFDFWIIVRSSRLLMLRQLLWVKCHVKFNQLANQPKGVSITVKKYQAWQLSNYCSSLNHGLGIHLNS